jgi:acyl carrier protein
MNTTAERVKALIANTADCGIEHVADDKSLSDLGLDSMDRYELTLHIEEAFDIEIPDEDAAPLNTVGEVVALVERMVGAKA